MRFRTLFVVMIIVFVSCSSSPEEMIIGTWNYDRIEFNPRNSTLQQLQPLQTTFAGFYNGMKYEFHDDGTCAITYPLLMTTITTSYRVSSDGRNLNFADPSTSMLPTNIIKITGSELWLGVDENSALVFVKE